MTVKMPTPAWQHRAAYPSPPTNKQKRFLRHRGLWREGMTFDEARELIGRSMKAGAA